jgi:NADPH2:quinone reductase
MRCALIERFGVPGEVLSVGDRDAPEPGPGQVRLRLLASPIHNHDLAIIRGIYGYRPGLPAIPGTEAAGVVERLGPGVSGLNIGQRVAVAGINGAWAELFVAKANAVVPIPDGITDDVGCQLLAMPLSAVMLIEDLAVKSGAWIIQNAAAGAVGRLVEALAADRGIHVINLIRRKEAIADLQAEGARHVLSTDDPAWQAKIATLTGGAPVERALDSVGGHAANDLTRVLGPGGQLISFGGLSGEPLIIDAGNLIFKQAVVKGFWGSKRAELTPPGDTRRMIGELLRMATEGRLPLRVAARFGLDHVEQAAIASEKPGRFGKIVLRPA